MEKIVARQRFITPTMSVSRVLPVAAHRHIGPWVFFDHMGPTDAAGDVLPHPHIGLATVTYLFAGEITHRDSIGSEQVIAPGDINWMIAGRGIAHSERAKSKHMHGLQLWIGLPREYENAAPSFRHYPAASLPSSSLDGASIRVMAGEAFGMKSPVEVHSPLFYVDVSLQAGAHLQMPRHMSEYGAYDLAAREMLLQPDVLEAGAEDKRFVLIGGEPLPEQRFMYWNFVSSSSETIYRAIEDWREDKFTHVVGDEGARIPAPDGMPRFARKQ